MSYPIHLVDVFTERPLAGNQLAVVLDADGMDPAVMQRVAREMNIAETTFVMKPNDPRHAARVRIFTPATELPFAGHPTIGTGWVLFTEGRVPSGAREFVLEEAVGPVPVRVDEGSKGMTLWMRHPPLVFGEVVSERAKIAAAIGLDEGDLLPEVPLQGVSTGNPFLFVALSDARAVDAAVSDKARLASAIGDTDLHGVFLFAVKDHARLYSRMFAPHALDIPEDPATGSASGPLGAFAVKYGLVPRAKRVSIVSEQGTRMGRQSFVHIELTYEDDGDVPSRVEVGGSVRPVITGTLVGAGS
jgi:trans-2,3-dihydro-3-hydroxyanthranilate isomerase